MYVGAAVRSPGVVVLGRFGYAGRGIVHALIGVLAGAAALGQGGAPTDGYGAILTIYQQPFGQYLLRAVTACLFTLAG
jgi:hypothetical protein